MYICFSVLTREFLMFVKNWNAYINDSTRAKCYMLYGNLRFQPYLNLIHIEKNYCHALEYRLTILKLVKWNKQGAVTLNERKCRTCLNCLELCTCILLENDKTNWINDNRK